MIERYDYEPTAIGYGVVDRKRGSDKYNDRTHFLAICPQRDDAQLIVDALNAKEKADE